MWALGKLNTPKYTMSFSADKVPILQRSGTFSNRRFSSTKDPTENGELQPHASHLANLHPS